MEENRIETPLSEMDSNVTTEETLSTNTADSDVEEVQEFDPEVEAKAQELMELVKAYNKLKRKEANSSSSCTNSFAHSHLGYQNKQTRS